MVKAASYQAYQVKPGCWNVSHVTPELECQVSVFGVVGGDDAYAKAKADAYAARGNAGEFDEREAWRTENKPSCFNDTFVGPVEIAEPAFSEGIVRFEDGDSVVQRAMRKVNGDWQSAYYHVWFAETRAQTALRLKEEQWKRELDIRGEILRGFFGESEGCCCEY